MNWPKAHLKVFSPKRRWGDLKTSIKPSILYIPNLLCAKLIETATLYSYRQFLEKYIGWLVSDVIEIRNLTMCSFIIKISLMQLRKSNSFPHFHPLFKYIANYFVSREKNAIMSNLQAVHSSRKF